MLEKCISLFENAIKIELVWTVAAILLFLAASILLIRQGWIALSAMAKAAEQAPKPGEERVKVAGATLDYTAILQALPNLINALAKAPAAIVLVIMGLLLIWLPDAEPGETCLAVYQAEQNAKLAEKRIPTGQIISANAVRDAKGLKTTMVWNDPAKKVVSSD